MLPDPLPAVRGALIAQSAAGQPLAAAVGRVYSENLPAPFVKDATNTAVPALAIVVKSAGGGAKPHGQVGRPRLELRVYGPTRAQARELWYAAANVLLAGSITRAGARVTARLTGGPDVDVELETKFPLATGFFDTTTVRVY